MTEADAPSDKPVYLTQAGIERLESRLAELKKNLPELALEAERTAAFGDRSDNAEYKEAKYKLRNAHGQIRNIEDQLRRAVAIKPGLNASGTIQLGSKVTLETKDGTKKIFEILGPKETRPEAGRISHESPLGSALINRKKGEIIKIETENGSKEYKIIEIG